jgi:tetratricopeptide (TPR) repeat protein
MASDNIQSILDFFLKAKTSLEEKSYSVSAACLKQAEFLIFNIKISNSVKSELLLELAAYFQVIGLKKASITALKSILKLTNEKIMLAKVHLNLGVSMTLQGLYEKSIFHNSKALFLLYESQEFEGIVSAYYGLALCCQKLGQIPKSIHYSKQGLTVSTKYLGSSHKLTQVLRSLFYDTTKDMKLLGCKNSLITRCEEF